MVLKRVLGRSGIEVSAIGLGCWAIGGLATFVDRPSGWGKVDDQESIRSIHFALDHGINFLDTSPTYGVGHSERILGQALAGRRDKVVIATKFGYIINEEIRLILHSDDVVGRIRQDCQDSLRRLNTDYIDIYQFHLGNYNPDQAEAVREVLDDLVKEGLIRYYGWSTDSPERPRLFAQGQHCTAIQHVLNIGHDAPSILAICDEFNQASLNRSPLGMGLLTGKLTPDTKFPDDDNRHQWNLNEGWQAEHLKKLDEAGAILTNGGRTLAQGALAWILGRSTHTVPIPGFKTLTQVEENIKTLEFGPMSAEEVKKIDAVFGRV